MCGPSVCGVVEAGCSVRFGLCVLIRERCGLCTLGGVTGTGCASSLRLVEGLVMIVGREGVTTRCGAGDAVRKCVSQFTGESPTPPRGAPARRYGRSPEILGSLKFDFVLYFCVVPVMRSPSEVGEYRIAFVVPLLYLLRS